jgi:hypothetical protein
MQIFPPDPVTGDRRYISVTAVNRGNAPTTITHFCGFRTKNLWDHIRGKRQNFIVNAHHRLGKDLPYVLAPGEEWSNLSDQDDLLEKFKDGLLYIGVIHNQRKKPVYACIRFTEMAINELTPDR